ncbi:type 1 glutamine amidotransferase [Sphingomonas kyeonggiensis]|uniref:ThuA domain-containing protein n=1 Tax=Sphingomonas kyeonggiensis TaxID=1268553 RepID=UPI002786D77D|nr:ThuA domain-containing protein [Sphingomonas kyeonggiensis]MDQ0251850.1 type 1 glutamine amidotransferase [Sphingomonas kyeonggiensis]
MRARLTLALCAALGACGQPWTPHPPAPSATPYVKNPVYWPTPVMDSAPPALPVFARAHRVLIFSKTNGFRDSPQIAAANAALARIAAEKGWDSYVSENAAVFNPAQLRQFDVILLNSISGNVFTEAQRKAFRAWLAKGGGLVMLHGSGGDHDYDWRWYVRTLLGAQFIGHTSKPNQFQLGTVRIAEANHPAMQGLPMAWRREEEWYAFDRVPSGHRTRILAWLDEGSYQPAPEQRMGARHPIVWTRCVGRSRVFFSALGHKAETYAEPLHLHMIDNALDWAADARTHGCD